MFIPFDQLPAHSKIWVYQSNRKLDEGEEKIISSSLKTFCEQWAAHGQPLKTSFKIEHAHFLIIAVDEGFNNASGCSIDGSVRVLKELQAPLNVDFFDRTQTAFLIADEIQLYRNSEIRSLFSTSQLLPSTITFHNLVTTKADWETSWRIPTEKSWLTKYLPNPALS